MLTQTDFRLLSLNYFPDGDTLYICGEAGRPLCDRRIQELKRDRRKIISLADRWGYRQATLIGKAKNHYLRKDEMPNLITGHGLILTPKLNGLLQSWIDAGEEMNYGLVRLYNKYNPNGLEEAQIGLSSNTNDLIWDISTAIAKRREDYVEPADLEDLRRLYSQADNFTFTFRSIHKRAGNRTAHFTNEYQRFEDDNAIYQISRRLELRLV